jgi:hypothetical protein
MVSDLPDPIPAGSTQFTRVLMLLGSGNETDPHTFNPMVISKDKSPPKSSPTSVSTVPPVVGQSEVPVLELVGQPVMLVTTGELGYEYVSVPTLELRLEFEAVNP